MSNITTRVVVNKADAYCSNPVTLTSGMASAKIQFEFSDEWTGLGRTAVFKANNVTKYVILTSTNICSIPSECLATSSVNIVVGVYGTDGDDVIIPTVYCSLGLIAPGTTVSGSEPGEITQSLYNQVSALLTATSTELTNVKETAVKQVAVDATGANQVGTASVSLSISWVDASDHTKGKKATFVFTNLKGIKGDTGDTGATGATGNGIASVTLVSGSHIPGGLDTYRITFTDSTAFDFQVYNGANGTGSGDMMVSVYDTDNGRRQVAFKDQLHSHDNKSLLDNISSNDITAWNAKYDKPATGIPSTDMTTAVQTSLGKADTALQEHQSLSAYRTAAAQDVIDAGKYEKPSGGIPSTDMTTAVQTSLGKADTALQEHQSLAAYRTATAQDVIDNAQSADIVALETLTEQCINVWDECWEVGGYNSSTGQPVSQRNAIRTKNYISVKPSTVYFAKSSAQIFCYWYDSNHAFISGTGSVFNATITSPNNAYYLRFETTSSYGETYNNDISINYPSSYTGYYPSALPRTNANVGGLGNAIGMRGWNQLCNATQPTQTIAGVTYTNNGNGTITVNGTATGTTSGLDTHITTQTISGHKYYFGGCPSGGSTTGYFMNYTNNISFSTNDVGNGVIFTEIANSSIAQFRIYVAQNSTASNKVFKPQLIDLTALFGAGNEPTTVQQFRAMFPADYYPYCSGSWADLLWTNASPDSEFASQTINLNLSGYSFVEIQSFGDNNSGADNRTKCSINAIIPSTKNALFTARYGDRYCGVREITVTNSAVYFGTAGISNSWSDWFTNNTWLVPYKIYGIR